jgi:hypothetical protein
MHVPIGLRRACWLAVALMASMAVTHTAASVRCGPLRPPFRRSQRHQS